MYYGITHLFKFWYYENLYVCTQFKRGSQPSFPLLRSPPPFQSSTPFIPVPSPILKTSSQPPHFGFQPKIQLPLSNKRAEGTMMWKTVYHNRSLAMNHTWVLAITLHSVCWALPSPAGFSFLEHPLVHLANPLDKVFL